MDSYHNNSGNHFVDCKTEDIANDNDTFDTDDPLALKVEKPYLSIEPLIEESKAIKQESFNFQIKKENQKITSKRKVYQCNDCSYHSDRKHRLIEHFDKYHLPTSVLRRKKKHVCNECGKHFSRKDALNKHYSEFHTKDGMKTYVCNECNYPATREINLEQHVNGMHKGIFLSCVQCNYRTKWKGSLNMHLKLKHHNNENYVTIFKNSHSISSYTHQKERNSYSVEN